MSKDVLRKNIHRRTMLAAVLGVVAGVVVCLRLEARNPRTALPTMWRPPALAVEPLSEDAVGPSENLGQALEEDTGIDGAVNQLDLRNVRLDEGRFVQTLDDGRLLELSLLPRTQDRIRAYLADYEVPFGAVVALDPKTGAVLSQVEVAHENPSFRGLALKSVAPAASVFKIVTAAALLERAHVPLNKEVCFHGGLRGLDASHLRNDPGRDTRCETFMEAFAHSRNAVFAKLTDRELGTLELARTAEQFGFERPIPFELPVEPSRAHIPGDRLERARVAAGFRQTRMSPLHGALIAAAIANDGEMFRPRLVANILDPATGDVTAVPPRPFLHVANPETARNIGRMMEATVAFGTASRAFAEDNRPDNLRGVTIAGKTGSLSSQGEERFHFSWFVGYAPADAPRVAVAVLMVNRPKWKVKALQVARNVFHWTLLELDSPRPAASPEPAGPPMLPPAAAPATGTTPSPESS